jgi:hypothetical protein
LTRASQSRFCRRVLQAALFLSTVAILIANANWADCLAQADVITAEYNVKAAFLYKFPNYVEWPAQAFERPDSPLVIGIAGADTLADQLVQTVADRTVGGRPVMVRKLRRGEALAGVHMLFVGRDSVRPAEVLAAANGKPVLTVTESQDAFALGSVINFVVMDDKVRFDVALGPAELGNLKVSARLLTVARKILAGSL